MRPVKAAANFQSPLPLFQSTCTAVLLHTTALAVHQRDVHRFWCLPNTSQVLESKSFTLKKGLIGRLVNQMFRVFFGDCLFKSTWLKDRRARFKDVHSLLFNRNIPKPLGSCRQQIAYETFQSSFSRHSTTNVA